jgi:UDP-glucuronate decarboxylase
MHRIIKEDLENIVEGIRDQAGALEGKTVFISGGAGFLGSYFLGAIALLNEKFLRRPCSAIALDNYITGSRNNFLQEIAGEHIRILEGDVTEPLQLEERMDYVIHAAGLASPIYYKKFPLETIQSAIGGAKNLLDFVRGRNPESFLFFSSSEIYGDPDPNFIPTPETYKGSVSCVGPRACYDESKRLAETLCLTYYRVHGVPVKIVRPFNVYGPGMKMDDYRVIPTFITRSLSGLPLPVHGSGNQTRTFCYVSDAVTGFFKVLLSSKNGEIYNVGTESPEVNMVTLATMMAEASLHSVPIRCIAYPESYPADEPNRRCPDLTKIKAELGYAPKVNLSDGIARTMTWFRDTFGPSNGNGRLVER